MKSMSKRQASFKGGMDIDSGNGANWKTGTTKTQQMYIAQKYREKYDLDSDEEAHHADEDELQAWKAKPQKKAHSK